MDITPEIIEHNTTGTTIDACAECLKRAGVKEVYAVTLCVGRGF